MIKHENINPEKIAYDRPSDKLLKFLKKYYNLKNYIPQNNNFVIYEEYFFSENSCRNYLNNNSNNKNNYDNYDNFYQNENEYNYRNNGYNKNNDHNNEKKFSNKRLISTNSTNVFSSRKKG